jgi:hypothetical protein
MQLPLQSGPVIRILYASQTSQHLDASELLAGAPCTNDNRGLDASGYEQCYSLTGPAQRMCLLLAS